MEAEEVHGDVLTVDVFIHHISDGLGHAVRNTGRHILPGRNRGTYCVRGHSSLPFSKNTHRAARKHVAGEAGCGQPQEAPLAFRRQAQGMLNTCKADLPH